jgi:hypothetical protein
MDLGSEISTTLKLPSFIFLFVPAIGSAASVFIERFLNAGDKVIIEGLQKVAPGAQVKSVDLTGDGATVATR